MARKCKKGLGYFSHDTGMSDDPKVKLLLGKHGVIGYGIFNKILEDGYKEDGYYFDYTEDNLILLSASLKLEVNIITNEIVPFMLSKGLFDKNIFDKHQILTSTRMQENYVRGCEQRKVIEFDSRHLLIDIEHVKTKKSSFLIIYTDLNEQKTVGNEQKTVGNEQKTVGNTPKEIVKGNSKENYTKENPAPDIAQNQKRLDEVIKQVGASMNAKAVNIFEYILVGNNGYQTRRPINLPQIIKAMYRTPRDLIKSFEYAKTHPSDEVFDDDSALEYLAEKILYANVLDSTGINSNLKPELVREMRLILNSKQKTKT